MCFFNFNYFYHCDIFLYIPWNDFYATSLLINNKVPRFDSAFELFQFKFIAFDDVFWLFRN